MRVLTQTDYLMSALDSKNAVRKAVSILKEVQFDTIVCTGVSGLILAPIVAYEMDKLLLVVRKVDDRSTHSCYDIEGRLGYFWLFLDDCISSGATRTYVINQVDKFAASGMYTTNHMGSYTYSNEKLVKVTNYETILAFNQDKHYKPYERRQITPIPERSSCGEQY